MRVREASWAAQTPWTGIQGKPAGLGDPITIDDVVGLRAILDELIAGGGGGGSPTGPAGGDLSGTYPNPSLATIGSSGSAGTSTTVPKIAIDAKGRVTMLASVAIAFPPSGSSVINVKDYGAVGDDSTNDTAAIAAALAVAISDKQALYFPPGIYLTDTIAFSSVSSLTIFGDGIGVSTIKGRTPTQVLHVTDSEHINVFRLTFDGNCTTRTAGQQAVIFDASESNFCDNEIIHSGEYAFFAGSGSTEVHDLIVSRNYVRECFADGINFQYVTRSLIVGNIVDGSDDDCIALGYNGSGATTFVNVIGNYCRARDDLGTTWGRGILAENVSDCLIEGNFVNGSKQTGILVNNASARPSRNKVIGNYVLGVAIHSGHGIAVYGSTNCSLIGNCVEDPLNGNLIEIADWQGLVIEGGSLRQSLNLFARGIHCDESAGWAASWDRLTIKGVTIEMLGAATNSCVYLSPDASVTMNTLIIDGVTGYQVVSGDYITVASARAGTLAKITNNTASIAGVTIAPSSSGGVFTVANNN